MVITKVSCAVAWRPEASTAEAVTGTVLVSPAFPVNTIGNVQL